MKLTPTLGGAYSGSLGGITASHNAGGSYLRRRSVPTNPNTARQQAVRSIVGSLTNAWTSELSEPERQAWRDYGANTPTTDSLGQTVTLSGINQYVRSNVVTMQLASGAGINPATQRLDAAPVVFNTGQPVSGVTGFEGVFTAPPGTVSVTAQFAAPADDDGDCYLFIAPPQTAGTRFYKGPYQLAATASFAAAAISAAFTALDLSVPQVWQSETVPVAAWDGLSVPLRLVNRTDDGRVSEVFRGLVPFSDVTP